MKKLLFADGSVGYRDKGTWVDVENNPVVGTEAAPNATVADVRPAPIEEDKLKQYDDTKPIKDLPDATE